MSHVKTIPALSTGLPTMLGGACTEAGVPENLYYQNVNLQNKCFLFLEMKSPQCIHEVTLHLIVPSFSAIDGY